GGKGAAVRTEIQNTEHRHELCNALPGSKVRFTLHVSGTPPLAIKWFKNKKEILPSAECSVIKDSTSSSLELFSAKTSDSGEYVCEVQNAVGNQSVVPVLCNEHILSLHCTVEKVYCSDAKPTLLQKFCVYFFLLVMCQGHTR
uniref:Ig-like domain-containing protein n=1 Tax=Haplochromis burtoni TaxID=8153 RepID=A0A3Q3CZS7_HAPBU